MGIRKNRAAAGSLSIYKGIKNTRLGGIEPPHLPPEGSALSTELQTYILTGIGK